MPAGGVLQGDVEVLVRCRLNNFQACLSTDLDLSGKKKTGTSEPPKS